MSQALRKSRDSVAIYEMSFLAPHAQRIVRTHKNLRVKLMDTFPKWGHNYACVPMLLGRVYQFVLIILWSHLEEEAEHRMATYDDPVARRMMYMHNKGIFSLRDAGLERTLLRQDCEVKDLVTLDELFDMIKACTDELDTKDGYLPFYPPGFGIRQSPEFAHEALTQAEMWSFIRLEKPHYHILLPLLELGCLTSMPRHGHQDPLYYLGAGSPLRQMMRDFYLQSTLSGQARIPMNANTPYRFSAILTFLGLALYDSEFTKGPALNMGYIYTGSYGNVFGGPHVQWVNVDMLGMPLCTI